ncbi:MAG: hypothetical protein IJY39_02380 [Clostridia bacterium]|nr:hypothetical protein [Clostridia bacterium]
MKKNTILKVISIVLALIMIFAIICAVTVKGYGVLDFSNIARAFFIGIAVLCGFIAVIVWMCAKPKG